jgi:hypothetical protein
MLFGMITMKIMAGGLLGVVLAGLTAGVEAKPPAKAPVHTDDYILSEIGLTPEVTQGLAKANQVVVTGLMPETVEVQAGDRVTWKAPRIPVHPQMTPNEFSGWLGTKKSVVMNEGAIPRLETDVRQIICSQSFEFSEVGYVEFVKQEKKPWGISGNAVRATLKDKREIKGPRPPSHVTIDLSFIPAGADPQKTLPSAIGFRLSCQRDKI